MSNVKCPLCNREAELLWNIESDDGEEKYRFGCSLCDHTFIVLDNESIIDDYFISSTTTTIPTTSIIRTSTDDDITVCSCNSSMINNFVYDKNTKELKMSMVDGRLLRMYNVSKFEIDFLFNGNSIGRELAKMMKVHYVEPLKIYRGDPGEISTKYLLEYVEGRIIKTLEGRYEKTLDESAWEYAKKHNDEVIKYRKLKGQKNHGC